MSEKRPIIAERPVIAKDPGTQGEGIEQHDAALRRTSWTARPMARVGLGLALLTTAALGLHAWADEDKAAATDAVSEGLASHRAVYRISLAKAGTAREGFARADGRFVLEWQKTCGGATLNQRMVTEFVPFEGEAIVSDLAFSSWEAVDGSRLRFSIENRINDTVDASAAGTADRATGEILFSGEEPGTGLDLPAETLFPTELTTRLMTAAREKTRSIQHLVYDGDEEGQIMRVTGFIGDPRVVEPSAGPDEEGYTEQLEGELSWPVTLAYFEPQGATALPDYQVAFNLYANGVSDRVMLDYGTFVLKGELIDLEFYKEPVCGG